MWKESYRVGVERIDEQHIKLFQMVDNLLAAIDQHAEKCQFVQVITFLKDYVVYHFKDEEEYQLSIKYPNIEEHKKVHSEFTSTVLSYEKRLIQSNFELSILKELAGMLTAWLIYHVADADQKIVREKIEGTISSTASFLDYFYASSADVLVKMAGLSSTDISSEAVDEWETDGVLVKIKILGDRSGSAVFSYSRNFACQLIKTMMFMEVQEIDEIVSSTLSEVTNIVCGNAMTGLSLKGIHCDLGTPLLLNFDEKRSEGVHNRIQIQSSLGTFGIWLESGLEI